MTGRDAKRVVRLDLWIDGAFDARLAQEPDIALSVGACAGPPAQVWPLLERAHVYHVSAAKDELPRHWFVDEALLARCPALLCASSGGAGYDTVDVAACTRAGVAVVNQAGANAVSVAEHAFGLMLAVSRRIAESDRRLRGERGYAREDLMGREISGKVLGLVGLGHIGTQAARIARGFDMTVLASDPLLDPAEIAARGATAVDLDTLLGASDVVSLHCPRQRDTLNLMGAREFSLMKRGAIFVSTARGGIHDEAALYEALRCDHLGGAGLDVWQTEPPPLDAPLLTLPNVVATFHTGGVSHEARRNVAAMAADQIVTLLSGRRPPRLVNPEVWPAWTERYKTVIKETLP